MNHWEKVSMLPRKITIETHCNNYKWISIYEDPYCTEMQLNIHRCERLLQLLTLLKQWWKLYLSEFFCYCFSIQKCGHCSHLHFSILKTNVFFDKYLILCIDINLPLIEEKVLVFLIVVMKMFPRGLSMAGGLAVKTSTFLVFL